MFASPEASKASDVSSDDLEGGILYNYEGEYTPDEDVFNDTKRSKSISVGDYLPYGPRMYYETGDNVVRMKDIGEKHRIIVVGVIGSFTPDCWNRHLYLVLDKIRYFEEREVDYICCISTNDPFTQKAWGAHLGCEDTVLMWSDPTKRFTKAIGMDIVVPWLDNNVRSKRFVLMADDMQITKLIVAPQDDMHYTWECEHLMEYEEVEEEEIENQWI
ncbi:hypothetical protein RUM43_014559 [Polyplax serrata]|uniref:Redoxin domain-containing protein n=1 Tax=Polyplax serrata TaxID=468196 RepID=A0AAN8NWM5_POLSC